MKKLLLILLTLSLGLYASESSAQIFTIDVTNFGAGAGNATFENFVNAEIQKIEDKINEGLPSAPPERLMEGMANSSVLAGKGLGADYASGMQVFLIGAGVGVGADLEKSEGTGGKKQDLSGAGIAPGVVIGTNLSFLDTARILGMDTNRLNLYLNFMSYGHEMTLTDKVDEKTTANIDSTAMGFRLRYDWIKGNGSKWLGWGGVKFHFGYEYNKTDFIFKSTFKKKIDQTSSNGERINDTINGSPEAIINVATHSIPIELSTDIQILYFLSLYGGVGADYSFGEAQSKAEMKNSETTISCTGGACGAGTNVTVKPQANIDATGKVTPMLYRGFVGVQLNLPYTRIYVQGNKPFGNDLVGVNAGVRFVF